MGRVWWPCPRPSLCLRLSLANPNLNSHAGDQARTQGMAELGVCLRLESVPLVAMEDLGVIFGAEMVQYSSVLD